MSDPSVDRIAKRVTLWVGAFLVIATAFGMLNKWFIADPIVRATSSLQEAIADESRARQQADEQILGVVKDLQGGQEAIAADIAGVTYSKRQIDAMRDTANKEHAALWARVEDCERRIALLERRR